MLTVITGAAGFLGRAVTRTALASGRLGRLRLVDRVPVERADPRCETLTADLVDIDSWQTVLDGATHVLHLAALAGGASELDPRQSRRINLDANLNLLHALKGRGVRLVYASSIAVFGSRLPERMDERTACDPDMTYGTHKRMSELALADMVRRGSVDAVALRLPAVVARPPASDTFKSAFLSDLFWKLHAREPVTLPVAAEATTWLLSRIAGVDNLMHLLHTRTPTPILTSPVLHLRIADLVAAIRQHTGAHDTLVSHAPDPLMQARFASYPPIDTPLAESLGLRRDADLPTLVRAAYTEST